MQQAIIDQELARLDLPALVNLIGIGMCGPTVIVHGSDDQKQRYLKRLLRADDIWCQLFSEPAAGSDLAGAAHQGRPRRRRLAGQRTEGLDDPRPRRPTTASCSPGPTRTCPSTAG